MTTEPDIEQRPMEFVGGPLWGGDTTPVPATRPAGLARVVIGKKMHPQLGPMALIAVYWMMPGTGYAFFIQEIWGPMPGRKVDVADVKQMEQQLCKPKKIRTKPKRRRR